MRDLLAEVLAAMKGNKRRIALTGFSIGWGLFIIIALFGAGNGLANGTKDSLATWTENLLTLTGGRTIVRHEGMPKGRQILFDDNDVAELKRQFPNYIKAVIPAVSTHQSVRHGTHSISTTVKGTEPDYMKREHLVLFQGRDLGPLDIERRAKVCVISKRTRDVLFPSRGENPIGQWVYFGGTALMVVGIYDYDNELVKSQMVYVPLNTLRDLFFADGRYNQLCIELQNVTSMEENETLQNSVTTLLAKRHRCAPGDRGAISSASLFDKAYQAITAINNVHVYIWVIGIATLLVGIVGVANIMLITVKERTRELGIRKAMGATNANIISMVLTESVIITLVFGYLGILLGVGLTELFDYVLTKTGAQVGFINPSVGFTTIVMASVVMVVAGIVAGYMPARRAVSIKLVDALNGL